MPESASAEATHVETKPSLVFFYSSLSGWAVRVDGFLANVLQRRRNHETFKLLRVPVEQYPELAERFAVAPEPTLLVIEGKTVVARLENPRGSREIEAFLTPWLRRSRSAAAAAHPAGGLASVTAPAQPERT